MKKILLVVVLVGFFSNGCGWVSRKLAWWTDYSEICVGGVLYYQFTSGATPAYNLNGTLKACK